MAEKKVVALSLTEAVAVKKDVVEDSLKKLLEKIKKERGVRVIKEKFHETTRLEKPSETIPEAFTQVMELEIEFESFKRTLEYVMLYGPSALEIMEPNELRVSLSEAQELVNKLTSFMHTFAAAGVGGIVAMPK
ncbi:MAG: hypothetical protein HY366_01810 [Candidatus Aenigmarchaeota archaeon]|nr:hypothetical protein [Candidatus Aenigmarchaeota archaeon]